MVTNSSQRLSPDPGRRLCLAKIKSAREMNNLQRGHVICVTWMTFSCCGVLTNDKVQNRRETQFICFWASVTIYDQQQEIVSYARCWQRGQVLGTERFQKELLEQRAAAERSAAQQRLISLLGPTSEIYLRRLANTDRSLARQVKELLALIRDYGPEAVAAAVSKAHAAGAFGADYIANILSQQAQRREVQPPLRFKDPELNELITDPG
jgi:hypothetical protein